MELEQKQMSAVPKAQKYSGNRYIYSTIPWNAIIAGVVISLGFQILLNFLGVTLGMITIHNSATTQKIVETSWLLISSAIAMSIGGWFVGTFSFVAGTIKNACYGIITWCIVAVIAVFITANVSNTFMGGLVALNNNPALSASYNSDEQYYQPQFKSVVLSDNKTDEHVGNEQIMKDMGKTSLMLFCNFLVGLIASALGAIIGDKFPISLKLKEK